MLQSFLEHSTRSARDSAISPAQWRCLLARFRGRLMPSARWVRRMCFVLAAFVAGSVASGCLKSSPVRPTVGEIPAPGTTVAPAPADSRATSTVPQDDSISRTSSPNNLSLFSGRQLPTLLSPPPPPSINPPAAPAPNVSPNGPQQGPTAGPISVEPPAEMPEPPATPLLDAAIERVEAIKRIQSETLAAELQQEEKEKSRAVSVIGASSGQKSAVAVNSSRPAAEVARPDNSKKPPAPANEPTKAVIAQDSIPTSHSALPSVLGDFGTLAHSKEDAREVPWVIPTARRHESEPEPVSKSAAAKKLEVAEFRLCRNITGFGSFESFADHRFEPGQRILIYCEMNGLEYEPSADSFLSRMSSHLELVAGTNGKVAWEQDLGSAEDSCRRIRRDYYVNYCIQLPPDLSPGHYRLRLIQTDLIGKQTAAADLPLEVRR
jgi:hypothetical protein